MPGFRSATPFFHRKPTHSLIERLAEWQSLVIYAGAGVTIDRTGYDWGRLVDALLEEDFSEIARRVAGSRLAPASAASAVSESLDRHRSRSPDETLRSQLRARLYRSPDYFGGELARSLATLALAWHRLGRPVIIVTPNYDTYIWAELLSETSLQKTKAKISLIDWTARTLPSRKRSPQLEADKLFALADVSVIHFHGAEPLPASSRTKGSSPGRLVFSENDYEWAARRTDRLLAPLIEKSNVLIVGSGMTDPPLIRNLLETFDRRRKSDGPQIAVVQSLQGIVPDETNEEDIDEIRALLSKRLDHLGIDEHIFPDFYSQTGQLLNELAIAGDLDERYASSRYRYGARLIDWWQAWESEYRTVPKRNEHAKRLRDVLASVTNALGQHDILDLELEVWLRLNVDAEPSERRLHRWVTSAQTEYRSTTVDAHSEIVWQGGSNIHPATETFCLGRSVIRADFNGQACVTAMIVHKNSRGHPSPIGVLVVQGPSREWRRHLSHANAKKIDAALLLAQACIAEIVSVAV